MILIYLAKYLVNTHFFGGFQTSSLHVFLKMRVTWFCLYYAEFPPKLQSSPIAKHHKFASSLNAPAVTGKVAFSDPLYLDLVSLFQMMYWPSLPVVPKVLCYLLNEIEFTVQAPVSPLLVSFATSCLWHLKQKFLSSSFLSGIRRSTCSIPHLPSMLPIA